VATALAPRIAAAAASSPNVVAGPRTTVAPFQAVPTPGPAEEHPSAPLPDVSHPGWDRAWLDERTAAPAVPDEPAAPATVVPPTVVPSGSPRPAESLRAPATGTPNGNPAYRDWTRPSGSGAPPATTAIPDRDISRGRASGTAASASEVPATEVPRTGAYEERFGDAAEELPAGAEVDLRDPASGKRPAATGPASGSQTGVVGGRAALRAGRQAAEEERRKEAKRNGVRHVRTPVPGMEDDEPRPPRRRRGAGALIAVVVVALLVLGVYSFASPETQEASDGQDQAVPSTSAPVVTSGALPPLTVPPLEPVDEAPATPVRVGVTVLNATGVQGLAGDIAGVLAADGWDTVDTGAYEGTDVGATTVYFTEGDDTQRQSALQLVEAHPEVAGPAVLFFEVPESSVGGLVVVATGDWQP
jgi:hypothetical protein